MAEAKPQAQTLSSHSVPHEETRDEDAGGGGEALEDSIAVGVNPDSVAFLVGKAAPEVGGNEAADEGEKDASRDQQLHQAVDAQPRGEIQASGQEGRRASAEQRARGKSADEVRHHEGKGEIRGAEPVGDDAKPRDLIAQTDEARERVEEENPRHVE